MTFPDERRDSPVNREENQNYRDYAPPDLEQDDWGYPNVFSSGAVDFVVSGILVVLRTSCQSPMTEAVAVLSRRALSTSTCVAPFRKIFDSDAEIEPAVSGMIYELRRLTGLNWDQIGRLMGVSRRTVHNWAGGSKINPTNHERLARLLSAVRYIDRGSAEENRELLLAPTAKTDGSILFDLLLHQEFDRVQSDAGKGPGRPKRNWGAVEVEDVGISGPESVSAIAESEGDESNLDDQPTIVGKPKYRRMRLRRE